MGKGEIISGGTGGLYQVRLVLNTARISALIVILNAQIVVLDAKINVGIDTAAFTAQIATLNGQISALDAKIALETDPARKNTLIAEKTTLQATIVALRAEATRGIDRLTLERVALQLRVKLLTDAIPAAGANIVSAWCADMTEDLTGFVGTIEVPGERVAVMIQPGYGGNAVYNAARDGIIQPVMAATPEAAFWNLAMLPGWQKWKPTYRFGVISNLTGDDCTVALEVAISSQQGRNVNQGTVLDMVPIQYMSTNGAAFNNGDAVVLKFIGQDYAHPVVIGFKHDPTFSETAILKIAFRKWNAETEEYDDITVYYNFNSGLVIEEGFNDLNEYTLVLAVPSNQQERYGERPYDLFSATYEDTEPITSATPILFTEVHRHDGYGLWPGLQGWKIVFSVNHDDYTSWLTGYGGHNSFIRVLQYQDVFWDTEAQEYYSEIYFLVDMQYGSYLFYPNYFTRTSYLTTNNNGQRSFLEMSEPDVYINGRLKTFNLIIRRDLFNNKIHTHKSSGDPDWIEWIASLVPFAEIEALTPQVLGQSLELGKFTSGTYQGTLYTSDLPDGGLSTMFGNWPDPAYVPPTYRGITTPYGYIFIQNVSEEDRTPGTVRCAGASELSLDPHTAPEVPELLALLSGVETDDISYTFYAKT